MNTYAVEWKSLPWAEFSRVLYRLQHRVYKESRKIEPDKKTIINLQSIIIRSASARSLAVRQVTQLNVGKKTAGVDGKASLTPQERLDLVEELRKVDQWEHSELRRIFIPKPDGTTRPLGIPTIRDRAMQCLLKYALEPTYEAIASRGSYGFRPARSAQDVQSVLRTNLRSSSHGYDKFILELDVEKCFDNIDHNKLMSLITLPNKAKRVLGTALKAGVLGERLKTLEGTPQGGVISPLLANIALHGLEDLQNEYVNKKRYYQRGIRYADDVVYILKKNENPIILRSKIEAFLAERGLKVKESKTNFVSAIQGFDFLGWNISVNAKTHKFLCIPSRKNRKNLIAKIKGAMRDTRYTMPKRLTRVESIYRGWFNYHKHCDLSQVNLWSISKWTYNYVQKNSKTDKGKLLQTVHRIFNRHWKIGGHRAVIGDKSVFDNDLIYWSYRNDKRFDGLTSKVLKKQNFRCHSCKLHFTTDDFIELHHVDGNNKNNRYDNLVCLHRSCHQQQHSKRKKSNDSDKNV
jgi:group II intron reverse transcriptase/maturase